MKVIYLVLQFVEQFFCPLLVTSQALRLRRVHRNWDWKYLYSHSTGSESIGFCVNNNYSVERFEYCLHTHLHEPHIFYIIIFHSIILFRIECLHNHFVMPLKLTGRFHRTGANMRTHHFCIELMTHSKSIWCNGSHALGHYIATRRSQISFSLSALSSL